jgi:hypothetical protein
MWSQANSENREQFAVIGDDFVLVLPEYKNESRRTYITKYYGYSWVDGDIKDPDGNVSKTLATIHTHQEDLSKEGWRDSAAGPSVEDANYFPYKTPNKPFFTMGYDGKIHCRYGTYKGIDAPKIPQGYNMINDLLKGAKFQLLIKSLK